MPATFCTLLSCGKVIPIGNPPYRIRGRPEDYCSPECVTTALGGSKLGRKKLKVPAEDFGDAGVVRHVCDRKACGQPILIRWPGAERGEYCSNKCSKIAESEGSNEVSDSNTEVLETETAPDKSPIRAGKPKSKTPSKKAAPKKAVGKKASTKAANMKAATPKAGTPKAKSGGGGAKTHWPRTAVIHKTATFVDCPSLKKDGTSAARVKAIRDGMTVADYLEALKKAGLPAGTGNLQACEAQGYIKIK